MLGSSPVHPILLSTDLSQARAFYHDKLGLEILEEDAAGIVFRCGVTKLIVAASSTGTSDTQTQLRWEVPDLAAELADLRSRGVTIEEYDFDWLKTVDGVADMGFGWVAWIVDPGQNVLAVSQLKG